MRSECGAHGGGNALRHLEFSRAITPIPVSLRIFLVRKAQHAYKCVVLPDREGLRLREERQGLNAPTGAWCSLTAAYEIILSFIPMSQCTYRCVVLPDPCLREWRYDATSRARSATGPGSTPADRPAPGLD